MNRAMNGYQHRFSDTEYEYLEIPNPFSAPVLYRRTVESTMDEAVRLAEEGFPPGTVIVAGFQSAGRGRIPGRTWVSPVDTALLCTCLVPSHPSDPASGAPLPLLVGLGLARAFEEEYGLAVVIKWPNDILCGGRKISGILCEARGARLLAGIGVNCRQREFSQELAGKATSLFIELGSSPSPVRVLESLLPHLRRALQEAAWRSEVSRRLFRAGEEVRVRVGSPDRGEDILGLLEGVGPEGELLLRTSDGVRRVYSGELVGAY